MLRRPKLLTERGELLIDEQVEIAVAIVVEERRLGRVSLVGDAVLRAPVP